MKKVLMVAVCAIMALVAGTATAEELRGRVAATARIGITNPADSERDIPGVGRLIVNTDAGIIGGGGFLFGIDDNIALDLEVTRSAYHTSSFGTAGVTDLSIGAQYRLPERQRFIPYVGGGFDVMINDLSDRVADTVVGLHLAGGVDYMLMRQVALNAEIKGVEAFSADVTSFNGIKTGKFVPSNIAFTVGARFFFN